MQTVIYADILFFINFIVTFVLLNLTSDFSRNETQPKRLIAGSFVGGIYSFIILAPEINSVLQILVKMIMLLSIVLVTFKAVSIKKYLCCILMFLLISFVFSGIMYTLALSLLKNKLFINNGYFYFDIGPVSIIVVIVICFLVIKLLKKTVFSKRNADYIYELSISSNNERITLKALYDSGNSVIDPFTGNPVIIVNFSEAYKLFDVERYCQIKNLLPTVDLDFIPEGIRLLPITSLGNTQLIPALTVESVVVDYDTGAITLHNPTLALTNNSFDNKLYSALINESVLKGDINGSA